jgi:gliding motility-associated-like protein
MGMKKTAKYISALLPLFVLLLLSSSTKAQSVAPVACYTDKDGNAVTESSSINDAQAPLPVEFLANPTDMDGLTPSFEWHFRHTGLSKEDNSLKELFVRYEENTNYTFMESGTYKVVLKTSYQDGTETVSLDSVTITIVISESKLEFPNAFSPNNDGINDIYGAKGVNDPNSSDHWKSIISFRAIILNRWGQKLYEWKDPAGGWDGKYNGKDVSEGVYYVLVEAKGADGKEYKIKKDVNLQRNHTGNEKNTSSEM